MSQDKIVVLKNTKQGMVADTVYNQNDTLFIGFSNKTTIEVPANRLEVNTYPPQRDGLEEFALIAAVLGGIAALVGAFIAFYQLFKKDNEKQLQIAELKNQTQQLIEQNRLFEKRIRMQVRPIIWSNGSGIRPFESKFTVDINNRGELAFLDRIEFLEGDNVFIRDWNSSTIPIEAKDGSIIISGDYGDQNPEEMKFRFLIRYHDSENFRYETEIEWSEKRARIIETREL